MVRPRTGASPRSSGDEAATATPPRRPDGGIDGLPWLATPLAQALRSAFPQAALLAPDAPWPVDGPAQEVADLAAAPPTAAASGFPP
jgi:hypothetical protein